MSAITYNKDFPTARSSICALASLRLVVLGQLVDLHQGGANLANLFIELGKSAPIAKVDRMPKSTAAVITFQSIQKAWSGVVAEGIIVIIAPVNSDAAAIHW